MSASATDEKIDWGVYDQLIDEGKSEQVARSKAKAAYIRNGGSSASDNGSGGADDADEPGDGDQADEKIDWEVYDQLVEDGKSEQVARSKAKAAYIRNGGSSSNSEDSDDSSSGRSRRGNRDRGRRRRRRSSKKPTWDLVYKRNSIERIKRDSFPMDVRDDLPRMIAQGYEAVPEEDIFRLNWWGLTHDKPKTGTFMVRIKTPGGQVTTGQLRGIGEISKQWGENYGELTTRQGLQLHHVALDELPETLEAIEATGLSTAGGEGDTVRNVTACPVAGIEQDELFDVRPLIAEIADYFYGNRDYSNLPRKHKFTVSTCPGQCNSPEMHDVALVGAVKDGRRGYAVRVGGGLSNTPRLSRDLGVFITEDQAIEVLAAVTDVWQNDPKYRISRAKARIKFMMEDHGPQKVREKTEAELGYELEDFEDAPQPTDYDHLGVHEQNQDGYVYAGYSVPMGWMTGDQMIQIADAVEAVGADIRLTRQQDFIVGNIPEDRLEEITEPLQDAGFPLIKNKIYGNSIACTSHKFCNYSVAETKGKLGEILEELEDRWGEQIEQLKVFMDGCPHSCAHHWVGDIGLQGTTTKDPDSGQRVEAYDVTLRGGLGHQTQIGKPLLRRVPTSRITDTVVRLVDAWLTEKAKLNGQGDSYTFHDFCNDRNDEQLVAIGQGEVTDKLADEPIEDEPGEHVTLHVPGTLLEQAGGTDEITLEGPADVRGALDSLREDYPALADEILTEDGVNSLFNVYVGEDDVKWMDGLDTALEAGDELRVLEALAGG